MSISRHLLFPYKNYMIRGSTNDFSRRRRIIIIVKIILIEVKNRNNARYIHRAMEMKKSEQMDPNVSNFNFNSADR